MTESSNLDRLTALAENLAFKLERLAEQHGSEAIQLAQTVARLDAIQGLISAAAFLAACALSVRFLWRVRRKLELKADDSRTPEEYLAHFFTLPGIGLALLVGALAFSELVDITRWAGAFDPNIWLAKKLLGL